MDHLLDTTPKPESPFLYSRNYASPLANHAQIRDNPSPKTKTFESTFLRSQILRQITRQPLFTIRLAYPHHRSPMYLSPIQRKPTMQSIQTQRLTSPTMKKQMNNPLPLKRLNHAIIKLPKKLVTPLKQNNPIPLQKPVAPLPRTRQSQKIHILTQIPTPLDPRQKPVKSPTSLTPRNLRIKNLTNPINQSAVTLRPLNTARFDRIIKLRRSPSLALRGRGSIAPDLSPPCWSAPLTRL